VCRPSTFLGAHLSVSCRMLMRKLVPVLLVAMLMQLGMACQPKDNLKERFLPKETSFLIDTLASGLTNPWGMAFLPDGRILITERRGIIRIWDKGKLSEPVAGVPEVAELGQGGLLDIALHPDFEQNGYIYLTFSAPASRNASTALARAVWKNNALQGTEVLFRANPVADKRHHFGSRIVFDADGHVYFTIGDRGVKEDAQDLAKHSGSVIRLNADGSIPEDNPFVGQAGKRPEIWSYGHRNAQGMVITPEGVIMLHEHGPKGGDEVNVIRKGLNYGWPLTTFGIDYDGSVISKDTILPGIEPPIHYWVPSIAPCGMAYVHDNPLFPNWNNSLLVGALAGQHICRVVLEGERVMRTENLLEGYARFRDVRQGPGGYIYALTESPGLLIRLRPKP
jgi:aldose sugar dehydrogenase